MKYSTISKKFDISMDMMEIGLIKNNSMVYVSRRKSRFGEQYSVVPNVIPRCSITNDTNYIDNKIPTTWYRDR